MPRKPWLSKEEIAKKFDLPERKSKIATLMKQDEVAYCVCRSSDTSRFMIGCDACEEWYHGDCIGVSEKESKLIKRYFCKRCQIEDPSLVTRFKSEKSEPDGRGRHRTRRCDACSNCLRKIDCGRCPGCVGFTSCYNRMCLRKSEKDKSPEWAPPRRSTSPPSHSRQPTDKDRKRGRKKIEKTQKLHRSRKRRDEDDEYEDLKKLYPPQQCYGPGCVNESRPGSKYCSDECGTRLAVTRIYQVLPQRIQERSVTPCIAEDKTKKSLERVKNQIKEVRASLKELDERHEELDKTITRGKQCKVEESEDNEEEDQTGETSFYCVTCGHEIHSRTAIRHMDKCFNKHEARTSFGSIHKTRIQGNNMFCDFYNTANGMYCKRLKVLCPEHSKQPKATPNEVCGYPMVNNVFSASGAFCRASRLNCMKHFSWEQLWRAQIDMERVRQWLKLDELVEKERELRSDMTNRGGILALMLHSTYNHEIMDKTDWQENQNSRL